MSEPITDAEIIAWARMLGDAWSQLFGGDSKAAYRFRRLADLAEKGAEDWKPIETAPEDEGLLLVWDAYENLPVAARFGSAEMYWVSEETGRELAPTHWRPLPAPPEGT